MSDERGDADGGVKSFPPAPADNQPDPASFSRRSRSGQLTEGALLNNAWRVGRLHARGGMGEVYEGQSVQTGDRVAIKVLLPHLAADPKTHRLLLSEARKMNRIRHEAVVHYIMMAEEPAYDVTYIVMDFIDGVSLGTVVGKVNPPMYEQAALMRRLAEGLAAAHKAGVYHRDLSPDNILLPEGKFSEATIIDFGIAKDLDPSHSTIVGDGFAGKLGFVAPEQFGDYNSNIGPWTDIYSLGLTLLSLALGHLVDMGNTLVTAVERRRTGPDVSAVQGPLQGVFARMLASNPVDRYQSMEELLMALANMQTIERTTMPPPRVAEQTLPPPDFRPLSLPPRDSLPLPPTGQSFPPSQQPTPYPSQAPVSYPPQTPVSFPPQPQASYPPSGRMPLPEPPGRIDGSLPQAQAVGGPQAFGAAQGPVTPQGPVAPQGPTVAQGPGVVQRPGVVQGPGGVQGSASVRTAQRPPGGSNEALKWAGLAVVAVLALAILASVLSQISKPAPTPNTTIFSNAVTADNSIMSNNMVTNSTVASTDPAVLAQQLVGTWQLDSLGCSPGIAIAASGTALTVTTSSGAQTGTVTGPDASGGIEVTESDGSTSTYTISGDTLTKTTSGGGQFTMTKCD